MIRKMLCIALFFSICILTGCKTKDRGYSEVSSNPTPTVALTTVPTHSATQSPSPTLIESLTPSPYVFKQEENITTHIITPVPISDPVKTQPNLTDEERKRLESLRERALSREIVEINNGDYFDLDGDSILEQIKYEKTGKNIYDRDYTLTIGDAQKTFYIDDSNDKLYLSHMTKDDESLQILIEDYGPSSDYIVNIFYYNNGIIYDLGDAGGLIKDIKSLGDGLYECKDRADTIQTWWHPRKFYISDVSMRNNEFGNSDKAITPILVRMPNEIYPVGTRVVLKSNLILYRTQLSKNADVKLQKGQYATLVASDDEEWIYLQDDYNESGWLRLGTSGIYQDEKMIYSNDLFLGLCNAD